MIIVYAEKEPDGGYTARAKGLSIFTQGDTLSEVIRNAREAVYCHFEEDGIFPPQIGFDFPVDYEQR